MISSLSAASTGTKLLVLAVAVSFVLGGGIAIGLKWSAGEVADAGRSQERAEKDRDGWKDAASKWESAVKAQNDENAKAREAAEKQRRLMDDAIQAANKAAEKFLDRLAELNRHAEADKIKCEAERARICGAPLR